MLSYKKFFESKQEVDSICRKYGIQNYTINPDESMIHLTNFNEKGSNDGIISDIMNIINDDEMLVVDIEDVNQFGGNSSLFDGFYGGFYNIYSSEDGDDDHIINVCKNVHDRLKNEDIDHHVTVCINRYFSKSASKLAPIEASFEIDDYDHVKQKGDKVKKIIITINRSAKD